MKETLIEYIFPNGLISRHDAGKLPKECRLYLSYAQSTIYQLPEGSLLLQRYTHLLFHLEVLEFNLHQALIAEYELRLASLFLFFMLQGRVKFYTTEAIPIYEALENICYGTFNQRGIYRYALGPGTHRVFFIIPNTEMINVHPEEYPELLELLGNMKKGYDQYGHMPECAITGSILQSMLSLLAYRSKTGEDLEIKLFERGKALLLEYHQMVTLKLNQLAYHLRRYLEENYEDSELSNNSIAIKFKISKRTLTRIFKATFGTSPHAYLISIRLARARQLLVEQKLPVNRVYRAVGYKDLRGFRSQFYKKFGFPPSKSR